MAARARVDVSLVSYYFGSKTNLFSEAIDVPTKPSDLVERALCAPREKLGEEIVRVMLTAWNDPDLTTAMRGIVQVKVTNQDNWAGLSEFYRDEILGPIASALGGDEAEYRAAMAVAPVIGLVAVRYLVGVPSVRDAAVEDLVISVGAQVQRWLTGPLD